MRSQKLPPRVFLERKHLIWIKYFQRVKSVPKLPKNTDKELTVIYSQIIHPNYSKEVIFAPSTKNEENDEDYLSDLFELKSPIPPAHSSLINYLYENKQYLDKSCKALNAVGHTVTRTVIQFISQFLFSLSSSSSADYSSSIYSDDTFKIFDIAVRMPQPYQEDIRYLLIPFFESIPSPASKPDHIFENQNYRNFILKVFASSLESLNPQKAASEYHASIFKFLTRYFNSFSTKLGTSAIKISDGELKNIVNFLSFTTKVSEKFFKSFHDKTLTDIIDSILSVISRFQFYKTDNADPNLYFQIGDATLSTILNFIKIDKRFAEYVGSQIENISIINFLAWVIDTFQDTKDLPEPFERFSHEIVKECQILTFEHISEPTDGLLEYGQEYDFLIDVKETNYNTFDAKVLKTLEKYVNILKSTHETNFTHDIFAFSKELLNKKISGQPTLMDNLKNPVIICGFLLAFSIMMRPKEMAVSIIEKTDGIWEFFFEPYLYDYTDAEISFEEHVLRTVSRREIFNSMLRVFTESKTYAKNILNLAFKLFIGAKMYICDELLTFVSTLFNADQKRFCNALNIKTSIPALISYGIELQKEKNVEKNNRFLCYLSHLMSHVDTCQYFLISSEFDEFLVHYLYDDSYSPFFNQLIRSSLLSVSSDDCFGSFCPVIHKILQNALERDEESPMYKMLDDLIVILVEVFTHSKSMVVNFLEPSGIMEDLVKILKMLQRPSAFNLAVNIVKLLCVSVSGIPRLRMLLDRCHYDLYDQCLPIFRSASFCPALADNLLYLVFERATVVTGDFQGLLFRNPNALIFLHHSTKHLPAHSGFMTFIAAVAGSNFMNLTALANSDVLEVMINFIRESFGRNHPSFEYAEKIVSQVNSWCFSPERLLQMITRHESPEYLPSLLEKLREFAVVKPLDVPQYFIALPSEDSFLKVTNIKAQAFTCSVVFRLEEANLKINLFTIKCGSSVLPITMNKNGIFALNNLLGPSLSIGEWHHLVLSVGNGTVDMAVDGQLVADGIAGIKTKEKKFEFTIGNERKNGTPLQMCIASFAIFEKMALEKIAEYSSQSYQQVLENKASRSSALYCAAIDRHRGSLIPNATLKKTKGKLLGYIGITQSLFSAVLSTRAIHSLILISKTPESFRKVMELLIMLIQNDDGFEKKFFMDTPVSVLAVAFKNVPDDLEQTEVIRILKELWGSLKNDIVRADFFSKVMFNLEVWCANPRIGMPIIRSILLPLISAEAKLSANSLSVDLFLSTIARENSLENRVCLWDAMFAYIAVKLTLQDQNDIVQFAQSGHKGLALEMLLRIFGIINLTEKTSAILAATDFSSLSVLMMRFIYLISDPQLRITAASHITVDVWKSICNEFLSMKGNQVLFSIAIITSQFHDPSHLRKFIDEFVVACSSNPLICARILENDLLPILMVYVIGRMSDRMVDFTNSAALPFFTHLIAVSLSMQRPIENVIHFMIVFAASKNVDVTPLIRNALMSVIKTAQKNNQITKYLISTVFEFIFFFPKTDEYSMNVEFLKLHGITKSAHLPTKTNSMWSINEIIDAFIKYDNTSLYPLTLSMRVDSRQRWLDSDLALAMVQTIRNIPPITLRETIYGPITVAHLCTYLISCVTRNNPNSCGDMIINFEKMCPPENAPKSLFAYFSFSLYNAVMSVSYWRTTFGRFAQKYGMHFGPHESEVTNGEEDIIFTNPEICHYTIQVFGETAVLFSQLIDRYCANRGAEGMMFLNSAQKHIKDLYDNSFFSQGDELIFASSLRLLANFESIYFENQAAYYSLMANTLVSSYTENSARCVKIDWLKSKTFTPRFMPAEESCLRWTLYPTARRPNEDVFSKELAFEGNGFITAYCTAKEAAEGIEKRILVYADDCKTIIGGYKIFWEQMLFMAKRGKNSIEVFIDDGRMIYIDFGRFDRKNFIRFADKIKFDVFGSKPLPVIDFLLRANFITCSYNTPEQIRMPAFTKDLSGLSEGFGEIGPFSEITSDGLALLTAIELPAINSTIVGWVEKNFKTSVPPKMQLIDISSQGSLALSNLNFEEIFDAESGRVIFNAYSKEPIVVTSRGLQIGTQTKSESFVGIYPKGSEMLFLERSNALVVCANSVNGLRVISEDYYDIPVNALSHIMKIDGSRVFCISDDCVIRIIDTVTRKVRRLTSHIFPVIAADYEPILGQIVSVDTSGKFIVSDLRLMGAVRCFKLKAGYITGVRILLFPSGVIVCAVDMQDDRTDLISVGAHGDVIARAPMGDKAVATCKIAIGPVTELVAVSLRAGTLGFYDARTLHVVKVVENSTPVQMMAYNNVHRKLITVRDDSKVYMAEL